ncbi:MAG: energy transducer TonB, partial [Myxococcota bacterium]
RPLERPSPEIPLRIRKQGLTGRVVLNLLIGSDGRVSQTKTLESQPPGVFDEIATEAVRRWRFSPALYRGEPVPVWGRQTVEFGGQG